MATMLLGKPVADEAVPNLADRANRLASAHVDPCLAVLRVGERAEDVAYENAVERRVATVGVGLRRVTLKSGADTALVEDAVRTLAGDAEVHGILVLSPLPDGVDEAAAFSAMPPAKDIDGLSAEQMAGLYSMRKSHELGGLFFPCTAEAVIRLLDHYGIRIEGKRAVVIGRSTVIGKPVAHLLLARGATVTVCHSGTPDLAEHTRGADILVCAAGLAKEGRAHRLGAGHLSQGQTVIDVAVNEDGDGMYGDVDMDAASGIVAAVTPVPGGLGAVTTLVLTEHVVRATERTTGSTAPRGALP